MRLVGTLATTAAAAAALVLSAPTANADAGACVSYLERHGVDTTVRVQVCTETETIGDLLSQEVAIGLCPVLMAPTFLDPSTAERACWLAVEK